MSIIIRQLDSDDAEGLVDFYNGLSGPSKRTFRPLGEKTTLEKCHAIIKENAPASANKYDWVACDVDRIVGWSFLWNLRSDVPTFGLGIADDWQGRGLGRMLMDRALASARELGLSKILLTVVQDNTKARKMYERRGFVKKEEFVGEDGLPYCYMVAKLDLAVKRRKTE